LGSGGSDPVQRARREGALYRELHSGFDADPVSEARPKQKAPLAGGIESEESPYRTLGSLADSPVLTAFPCRTREPYHAALGILEPCAEGRHDGRLFGATGRRRWPTSIATNALRRSGESRRRGLQPRRRFQAPRPIPSRPISRVEAAQAGRLRLDDENSPQAQRTL
jgi:hypothetical protein